MIITNRSSTLPVRRMAVELATVPPAIQHISGATRLPRHAHAQRYAAVVLRGGYMEAGLGGRLRADAGTVIVHPAYAAHLNLIDDAGAAVLNLPLPETWARLPRAFRIEDPDRLAKAAERSIFDALAYLQPSVPVAPLEDWPDVLARALTRPEGLNLRRWADDHRLDPASLSRGFRRVFGTSPRRFRADGRALAAVTRLMGRGDSIAEIAAQEGFADQAHMTRAVRLLTGSPPLRLREAKSVQD